MLGTVQGCSKLDKLLKLKAEPNSCHSLKVLQQSTKNLIEVKETQAVYLV